MKTFTILKPDTLKARNAGDIISRLEQEGFRIRAMKMLHLTEAQAQGFYYVHKERPFFPSLVKFMTEGPVILMVLEADNAIDKLRKVMGATDPAKADAGTIRKQFGSRLGWAGDGRIRDRLFLQSTRNCVAWCLDCSGGL